MNFFQSPAFALRVEELMTQHHVPGLAVAVVQDGKTASEGYGKASVRRGTPCTADTLFDIASASKSLTAAAVGLLVADDNRHPRVQYDAVVHSLLGEDFVLHGKGSPTETVTVEDMLSHRSGMAPHNDSCMSPRAAQPDDARSVTRNLRNLPIAAPVRSKFMYCNLMYTAASYLVEKQSGIPFADFLEERLFLPLDMHSTNLQPARAQSQGLEERMAMGHAWVRERGEYREFTSQDCPEGQGAGSIITSVNDYVRWVQAVMYHDREPITKDIYEGLVKPRKMRDLNASLDQYTSPIVYAAGWEVFWYQGYMVVNHDGDIAGFGARHFFLPDLKFGAVIFGNSGGAGSVAAVVARELIDEALYVPEGQRPDWNEIESESSRMDGDDDTDEEDNSNTEEKIRRRLFPGIPIPEDPQPQTTPLTAYTGRYWNEGYHGMTVQIMDGKLFVDATDRSFPFTLTFDHVCDQSRYVAHLCDYWDGGDDPLRAEFVLQDIRAMKMGLRLEEKVDDLIWFDRVEKGE